MPSLPAVVAVWSLAQTAIGQPTVSFPFNAQLPLAARIDSFFSYSFSPYTFRSNSKISYSLGDHPSWLSIDSEGRRLFGTPKNEDVLPGDVVGQNVDIIATDGEGSTSMKAVVVVSRQPAPQVQIPLEKQISNFGNFSAPSSILSYPSTNFKFSFDQGTFGKSGLNYYAVSGDSSPLPAWVKFDASSLTFIGKTPPIESLFEPPHSFDFNLVASDIVGFSASSLEFSIVVGSHELTTEFPIVMLNASRGSEVTYNGLENGIKLDGKQVSAGDSGLTVKIKDMPRWLSFDQNSWKLHGTPRDGDRAANFTVTFKDSFSDNLDVLMVVNVATGLFGSTIEDLQARPGSELELDLAKYFRNPSDVIVTLSTSPSQDWLKLNGLKLSGQVPKTSNGGFKLSIHASSKSSRVTEDETIDVSFLAADGTTTTGTLALSTATATTTTPTAATKTKDGGPDEAQRQSGHLSTGEILMATIIPVISVAILLMVLVCYFRRRHNKENYPGNSYRPEISRPLPSSLQINGSSPSLREVATTGGGAPLVHTETLISKPGKASLADGSSSMSSRRRSSETFGDGSTSGTPRSMMVDAARTTTIRSMSNVTSEDARQSWVTIERGNSGLLTSDRSSPSQQSDRTYSEPTYQVLPDAGYASHSKDAALYMSPSTLNKPPSLQAKALFAYEPGRSPLSYHSLGGQSGITSSSAALPHMKDGAKYTTGPVTRWNTASTAREDGLEPNWVTLAESEASGSAGGLSKQVAAGLGDSGNLGSSSSKSMATDVSFASSENWRIIGQRSPTKAERSYKGLVEESASHPSQPGTTNAGGAGSEGRGAGSVELMSPSRWAEEVQSPLASGKPKPELSDAMMSKTSGVGRQDAHMSGGRGCAADDRDDEDDEDEDDDNNMTADWIRKHAPKISDGSFKVFL
ncbi:hypothetical protein E4U42_007482 [Claviceps africana]|uniref:Cadherin-like protein n=1 Tax=Claviceps africana TaxID=83212 RepID=A0A8K0NK16_9HYPO|nr:hypothetical protein E4U42_007482 [Claviceps africana]